MIASSFDVVFDTVLLTSKAIPFKLSGDAPKANSGYSLIPFAFTFYMAAPNVFEKTIPVTSPSEPSTIAIASSKLSSGADAEYVAV